MRAALFVGLTLFLRHRVTSLIAALAIAVPLLVSVLGTVVDTSSRPSPELQKIAMVGNGAALVLPQTYETDETNQVGQKAAELNLLIGQPVHEVDLLFSVPTVTNGVASSVSVDQRDWAAKEFATILLPRAGRLPALPEEAAVSSRFASDAGIGLGGSLQVADTDFTIVGIYDRPFALDAAQVFVPRNSTLQVPIQGSVALFKQFVLSTELSPEQQLQLDPDEWLYQSGDSLVTKTSALTKTPVAYGLVILLAFLGLIAGSWTLSSRKRRETARTLTDLGVSKSLLVGGAIVEVLAATVVGIALAGLGIGIAGPLIHRRVASAAHIVAEGNWVPWELILMISSAGIAAVLAAATFFQVRLLHPQKTAAPSPCDNREVSLESRTRRAAGGRVRTIFVSVLLGVVLVSTTAVIWASSNSSQEQSTSATRRPGDVEIILPNAQTPPALAAALTEEFASEPSVVKIGSVSDATGQDPRIPVATVASGDTQGMNLAAPIQIIETRGDWALLTGRSPSELEWDALQSGRVITFMPELSAAPEIDVVNADTLAAIHQRVPNFYVAVDDVTLNRAKGAMSASFAEQYGIFVFTQSVIIHTSRTDFDNVAVDAGALVSSFGLSGGDIRLGRPQVITPPTIVVVLALGGAVLAAEIVVFSAIASANDERRTRRLLTSMGANYRVRFRFIFGIAGIVTSAAAVSGGILGIAIGAILCATWIGKTTVPWPSLAALLTVLVCLALLASALIAAASAQGRPGRR